MTDTYLQVRLDPKMKAEAEAVFANLGLSSTQAVKLFFRQVALRQAIPFTLTVTPPMGVSDEEEAMIAASMEDVQKGKVVSVDMKNAKQVKELFGI
jgi:DNA-damage-inducible protein J